MNPVNFINTVLFLTALAAVVYKGGRYERYLVLMFLADTLVGWTAQYVAQDFSPTPLLELSHAGLLAGVVWLALRYRPWWVAAMVAAQVGIVAVDLTQLTPIDVSLMTRFTMLNALCYLQLALLLYGTVRTRVGPPFLVPQGTPTAR